MQNGAVVNLSSLSAIQVNPDGAAYNIAKAAQDHLTKTLSRKYTSKGVRINSVNPGFVSLFSHSKVQVTLTVQVILLMSI